jgi:hypothetical protein
MLPMAAYVQAEVGAHEVFLTVTNKHAQCSMIQHLLPACHCSTTHAAAQPHNAKENKPSIKLAGGCPALRVDMSHGRSTLGHL